MDAMKLFNAARQDPLQVEKSLDMVSAYPLRVGEDDVSREGLRASILGAAGLHGGLRRPLNQRFEVLDETQALCLENWPTEDEARQISRWTFLVKRSGEWKIERIMTGEVKTGDDVCRGRS